MTHAYARLAQGASKAALAARESLLGSGDPVVGGTDFFLGRRRAMVSLGPVGRRHCSFSCAFCYVQGDFPRYPSLSVSDIVRWIADRRDECDIVYVSGDTDSFAPPRQEEGVELLDAIAGLGKDVLFTTRAALSDETMAALQTINSGLVGDGRLLIACISVSQLHYPRLEPGNIPTPLQRMNQLRALRQAGITTALTVRPFLPMLPAGEYADIVRFGNGSADVVIGGDFYADVAGVIMRRLTRTLGDDESRAPEGAGSLYFSTSDDPNWLVYRHVAAERAVAQEARAQGTPFFMGSEGAVQHLRHRAVVPTKSE